MYELVHTGTYMVCTSEWCDYTGFRGKQRDALDAALRDMVWPSPGSDSEQEHEDHGVPPEDKELFETPDADAMEETISKFVDRLEQQVRRGFTEIHTFATHWFSLVPLKTKRRHKAAQPDLNEKMGCDGTYSYVTVYTGIYHV